MSTGTATLDIEMGSTNNTETASQVSTAAVVAVSSRPSQIEVVVPEITMSAQQRDQLLHWCKALCAAVAMFTVAGALGAVFTDATVLSSMAVGASGGAFYGAVAPALLNALLQQVSPELPIHSTYWQARKAIAHLVMGAVVSSMLGYKLLQLAGEKPTSSLETELVTMICGSTPFYIWAVRKAFDGDGTGVAPPTPAVEVAARSQSSTAVAQAQAGVIFTAIVSLPSSNQQPH